MPMPTSEEFREAEAQSQQRLETVRAILANPLLDRPAKGQALKRHLPNWAGGRSLMAADLQVLTEVLQYVLDADSVEPS